MWNLLSEAAGARLSLALVHFAWQGAAIAVLLSLVLRWCAAASPQFRYLLSLSALGLMAACPVVTYLVLERTDAASESFVVPPSGGESAPGVLAVQSRLKAGLPTDEAVLQHAAWLALTDLEQSIADNQQYVVLVWLAGVSLLGLRLLGCYCGTVWLRANRCELPRHVANRVATLAQRMNMNATNVAYGSAHVGQAVALGLWRPIVLLPTAWLSELPPDVLEAVIAHELAHIRRWDLWATLGQRAVETLLFYHPAVWWVSRRASLEREMCCDELAVAATGRRMGYAQALEVVGRRAAGVSLSLAASFNGETQMNLLKRVRHVLGLRPERESAIAWPAGLLVLGVAVAIGSLSQGLVAPRAMADEEKKAALREGEREGAVKKAAEGEREGAVKKPAVREGEREGAVKKPAVREGEREGAVKKPTEREGDRKSPEAESKIRKPGEGDIRKPGEDEARRVGGIDSFKPQTDREEILFNMIQQLRKELATLRQEVAQSRDRPVKEGERPIVREGDKPRTAPREGDTPRKDVPRDGDKPKTGLRDGDVPRKDVPRKDVPRDGDKPAVKEGARDGDKPKTGPRDGDAPRKDVPRDGDKPAVKKEGAREGDAPRKE